MGGGNLHRTPAAGVSRSVRSYALALCMAFAIAAVPVQAQVKNITLKASNTPVSTVMQQIEEQSGYTFFYNTKDIPLDRNVTLSVSNKDIRAALDELFRNTNVSYSIDNKSIILSARGGAQPQQAFFRPLLSGQALPLGAAHRAQQHCVGALPDHRQDRR